jgi:hypothetical protein
VDGMATSETRLMIIRSLLSRSHRGSLLDPPQGTGSGYHELTVTLNINARPPLKASCDEEAHGLVPSPYDEMARTFSFLLCIPTPSH